MTSLIATVLVLFLLVGGGAVIAGRYAGLRWPGDRIANSPAVLALLAVLAACLAGWLLAVAFASR